MKSQGREKGTSPIHLRTKLSFTYFIASVSNYGLLAFQYS